MAETLVAEQWLYTVLSGDTALAAVVGTRIYAYIAPEGAAMPYVVYQNQAGRDVRGVGPLRIMANLLYVVKVIGATNSFGTLEVAANRIDAVLQAASGTNVRGTVIACVREQPFALVESLESGQYRHLGGIYRLWAK
jgi:hypothetical protein